MRNVQRVQSIQFSRKFHFIEKKNVKFNGEVNAIAETSNASPGDLIGWRDTPITEIDIRSFNPFRFSSEYHDDELNLIYYNYRHYDPATGRFLSRDPIEEQGGTNLYGMFFNDTINWIDVLGLKIAPPKNNSDGTLTPGDFNWYNRHNNPTTAARKRGKHINARSIRENKEYCGLICKKCTNGVTEYITTQTSGKKESCRPFMAACPNDSTEVATWHTHGATSKYSEEFSDEDKEFANRWGVDDYLFTPGGTFQQFIPGDIGNEKSTIGTIIKRKF